MNSITSLSWILAVALVMLVGQEVLASGVTCHIHPPTEFQTSEESPERIGRFSSLSDCEEVRQKRFGDLGRCHCVTVFGTSAPFLLERRPGRDGFVPDAGDLP
jgi:hypothetical protein